MSPRISPKRKGDLAELHVASLLLDDSDLEVFTTTSDDGHGSEGDLPRWRHVNLDDDAESTVVVDDIQRTEGATVREAVSREIHRPALVRSIGNGHRLARGR